MKTNKNEELQSRREFFKNAAKVALPVIGAVVLSQLPIKAQASEMGCDYGCSGSCYGACYGACGTACSTSCASTCRGGCYRGCSSYNKYG